MTYLITLSILLVFCIVSLVGLVVMFIGSIGIVPTIIVLSSLVVIVGGTSHGQAI